VTQKIYYIYLTLITASSKVIEVPPRDVGACQS
jgi:hypothetical protein